MAERFSSRVLAAQLDAVVAAVRLWIEGLLHRSQRSTETIDGVPRSRYAVSAGEAVRILTEAGRPDEVAVAERGEVAWRSAAPALAPLALLRERLGLDDVDARIVAALLAPEHDAEVERAYAFAWDDYSRRRPDAGFLVDLIGGHDEVRRAHVRRALAAASPLRQLGVVVVGAAGDLDTTPPARRACRLSDRIIAHLLGDDSVDPVLEGVAALAAPADPAQLILSEDAVAAARRALHLGVAVGPGTALPRVLLCSPAGAGKALLVRTLAASAGRPVLEVDLGELLRAPDKLDDRMGRIAREAALRGAVALLRGRDALGDDVGHSPMADQLAAHVRELPVPLVVTSRKRPAWLLPLVHELVEVDLEIPAIRARVALWRQALGTETSRVSDADLADIAGRFALTGAFIHRAGERVVAQARLKNPEDPHFDLDDLTAASRLMLQHRLGTVARRIEPGFSWDDLVLPADTLEGLREMLAFAKHRAMLLEEWGFERKLPYGRGVSAILAGPPGTGKTMVAQLLAKELGYDLYLIELAQVVNKYIGETEKNLAKVFDEAENSHAILFFDEADALFAKRTEVKSSTDRYANLEVNYLLQRMESYHGVTLLATNLEQGIDEAFKRRVRFTIQFELPEPPVREALWRSMFPPTAPVATDVDWRRLAERYEMAGGHIKKAVVRAAARALARGRDTMVTCADLETAAQLEYGEMGRIA